MSAAPQVRCGVCKGVCEKLIGTGAGIIFKGSGFYETDYKKKSGSAEAGETVKAAEKAGEKSSGKASSADPAPKKESKGGKTAGSGRD